MFLAKNQNDLEDSALLLVKTKKKKNQIQTVIDKVTVQLNSTQCNSMQLNAKQRRNGVRINTFAYLDNLDSQILQVRELEDDLDEAYPNLTIQLLLFCPVNMTTSASANFAL
jgi:hypothetical protein